jgi:hypothetical protein
MYMVNITKGSPQYHLATEKTTCLKFTAKVEYIVIMACYCLTSDWMFGLCPLSSIL